MSKFCAQEECPPSYRENYIHPYSTDEVIIVKRYTHPINKHRNVLAWLRWWDIDPHRFPRCASECGSTPEISLPHPLPRFKLDLTSFRSLNSKECPCSPSPICSNIRIKACPRENPPEMEAATEVKARDSAVHAVQCLGATPGSKLVTWLCKKVRHLK